MYGYRTNSHWVKLIITREIVLKISHLPSKLPGHKFIYSQPRVLSADIPAASMGSVYVLAKYINISIFGYLHDNGYVWIFHNAKELRLLHKIGKKLGAKD